MSINTLAKILIIFYISLKAIETKVSLLLSLSAIMLTERKQAAFAAHLSKSGIKPRHHREHFFQHITIYTLVRFNVFRLALECLFAERPAVEAHIVEVCPSVIDDVKAVGTRLVPRKAHA